LGHSHMQQSQLDEALSLLQAAHALAEQQDDVGGLAEVQRTLALAYLTEGRLDDATVAVEASLAAVAALNDRGQQVETRLVEARVLEARGDVAGAGESFESALQLLDEDITAQYRIKAYEEYSNFLERQGDNTRALDMLKQAWQAGGRS
jgi:tetratricopeptide (TPR) repeat protein